MLFAKFFKPGFRVPSLEEKLNAANERAAARLRLLAEYDVLIVELYVFCGRVKTSEQTDADLRQRADQLRKVITALFLKDWP